MISSKLKYHRCKSWININDKILNQKTVLKYPEITTKLMEKEIEL